MKRDPLIPVTLNWRVLITSSLPSKICVINGHYWQILNNEPFSDNLNAEILCREIVGVKLDFNILSHFKPIAQMFNGDLFTWVFALRYDFYSINKVFLGTDMMTLFLIAGDPH